MLWFSINFFPISWSINCSIDSLINLPLVLILFTHIEVLNSLVGVLLLVYYKFLMKFLGFFMAFFVPLIWVCHHCRWRHTWHSCQMSREASLAWPTPTVSRVIRLCDHLRVSITCCRAFDMGAVITCFYDSGISRPGIEPRFPYAMRTFYKLSQRGELYQ